MQGKIDLLEAELRQNQECLVSDFFDLWQQIILQM